MIWSRAPLGVFAIVTENRNFHVLERLDVPLSVVFVATLSSLVFSDRTTCLRVVIVA